MDRLNNIDLAKVGKERTKREYDLRVLNRVAEDEYESRMAIWNSLAVASSPLGEAKSFIDSAFDKLEQDLATSRRDLAINYNDFVTMANEEINYIAAYVADNKSQYFWYATITLVICLAASLYI